jgi:hypothetical protein
MVSSSSNKHQRQNMRQKSLLCVPYYLEDGTLHPTQSVNWYPMNELDGYIENYLNNLPDADLGI